VLGRIRGGDDAAHGGAIARTDLDGIVHRFADDGLDVRLHVTGELDDLPQVVRTSCLRIVRELLTNAARHAPDRRVDLRIRVEGREVEIVSRNAGTAPASPAAGHRLGLVGIGERVAAHGGRMESGFHGGEFVVRTILPVTLEAP